MRPPFLSYYVQMKKIVTKCTKQCVEADGVDAKFVREEVVPDFFKHFWVRRMALDRRNYEQIIETTVAVGGGALYDCK